MPKLSQTDRFLRCRTFRHAWFEYPSDYNAEFGTPVSLKCERCNTIRIDIINRFNGELLSRVYQYPDGYRYAPNSTPNMAEFRVALLSTMVTEARDRRKSAS